MRRIRCVDIISNVVLAIVTAPWSVTDVMYLCITFLRRSYLCCSGITLEKMAVSARAACAGELRVELEAARDSHADLASML